MPQRFYNPFPQFLTDAPAVREGARLFFYAAGGAQKLDTYPTRDLSGSPNPNPITLNEYGYSPVNIYLQDREYKIVLAPPGSDDPPTSAIWTSDYYRPTDFSIVTVRKVGSGNPTGSVAGTAGSSGVLPTEYWDFTNGILYVCTQTGDAATALWTALNAQSAANVVVAPQGYLSPSPTEAIITSDVIGATTLTYHRLVGDLVPIYNGATFTPMQLASDLTLTLHSSHAIDTIYDVFVFNNDGVPTLVTGPAWSVSTAGSGARGTGAGTTELQKISGIYTNKVSFTGRNGTTTYPVGANLGTYLGSFLTDGTAGQTTCHVSYGQNRKWGVWNAYNRQPICLKVGDPTSSWVYQTSISTRAANNNAANNMTVFSGLPEEEYFCEYTQQWQLVANGGISATQWRSGIGVNTTGTNSAVGGIFGQAPDNNHPHHFSGTSRLVLSRDKIGIHAITALEFCQVASPQALTFFGTSTGMLMTGKWRG